MPAGGRTTGSLFGLATVPRGHAPARPRTARRQRGDVRVRRRPVLGADLRGGAYRHLPDARAGIERGTVIVGGTVVRGFPKVPRTLVLETGIPAQFDGRVAVEEKPNGYNVRVADVEPWGVVAFTRSGMVCPFTTAEIRSWLGLEAFFADHPALVVCGEVYGPENPYTAHDYPGVDSLAFAAFDLRDRSTGAPLPVEDRRTLLEDRGVPQVPRLGTYDVDEAVGPVLGHVADLENESREGVVMKSADGRTTLKYTTSAANRGDLAYAFSLPFDYGQAFMFRRLIREAFRAVELGEPEAAVDDRSRAVGAAIVGPIVETIRAIEAGETVGERHTVRGRPETIDRLLAHLRDQGLELDVVSDRTDGDERVVTFLKVTRSTLDTTATYLDGHVVRE